MHGSAWDWGTSCLRKAATAIPALLEQRAGAKAARFNAVRMEYGNGVPFPISMAEWICWYCASHHGRAMQIPVHRYRNGITRDGRNLIRWINDSQ